jgi:acetyl esterase
MILDDDQAALMAAAKRAGLPPVHEDLGAARARVAAMAASRHGVEVAVVQDHVLEGPHGPLLVRQYAASTEPEQPALVYFHGGGMVVGSVEYCDTLCRQLCAESGVSIFNVDYRLAPEHKYPVATDEAYFATEWVTGHSGRLGVDATRLAIGGDSAGGSLAAGVTLQARDKGGPALILQLLIYPGLERATDRPSMLAFGNGPAITRATIDWMKEQYLGRDPALDTPYGVPALADNLEGLPEAIVVVGYVDPIRDSVEAYADRLFEAGVQTTIMRYPGVLHGFLSNIKRLRRADRCVSDMASVLKSRLLTP